MASSKPRPLGVIDEPFGARVTLRQTLDVVLEQAPGLIDKVIESLGGNDDKPAKGVGMVKPNFSPQVQAVVKLLIAHKARAVEVFEERLRYYVFLGVGASAQSPQLMRFEDLKLFDDVDLDESIEVAGAIQEVALQIDEIMPTVDALVSSLLGWITVQPQINPLRPEMFARALRDCITDQLADVEIRGAIIGHAAARMGVLLRKLYIELCQWLKSYGVEEASSVQPSNLPQVAKANPLSVSNSVARTLLTLDKLRRLLSGELDSDAHRRQDFLHTVPASVVALQDMRQVEAMVQRLEKRAKDNKDNPEHSQADAKRRAAQARMALKDGRELGKQLGEEVVRLMLDNLVQDERLLPRVRAHLQTLEPTLMHIAQDDARFFSDKQHAARQFLDAVTNRSLSFSHEREEGYEQFLLSVEQSIASLHKKTDSGETAQLAFGDVMERLAALWAKLDIQENARREEAALALLHAEQRNTIAQFVAQEFRANAEGLDIAPLVLDFVCGPWAHAVAESQLRCIDGRTDPQGFQGLVNELFWSVQPSKAKRNRKRLVQLIPGMLSKLRQGLAVIEFPPERITDFFAELIKLHEVALEGGRHVAAALAKAAQRAKDKDKDKDAENIQAIQEREEGGEPSSFDELQVAADRAELAALYAASALGQLPASDSARVSPEIEADSFFDDFPSSHHDPKDAQDGVWLVQSEVAGVGFVNQQTVMPVDVSTAAPAADLIALTPEATVTLPIGTWAELMLDGAWVRAQLTWASPMRSLFMFVSRGGKAHSMSKRTMDKLCSQGLIRVVSDGQMVDKALDAVAQAALRNSVGENRSGS